MRESVARRRARIGEMIGGLLLTAVLISAGSPAIAAGASVRNLTSVPTPPEKIAQIRKDLGRLEYQLAQDSDRLTWTGSQATVEVSFLLPPINPQKPGTMCEILVQARQTAIAVLLDEAQLATLRGQNVRIWRLRLEHLTVKPQQLFLDKPPRHIKDTFPRIACPPPRETTPAADRSRLPALLSLHLLRNHSTDEHAGTHRS